MTVDIAMLSEGLSVAMREYDAKVARAGQTIWAGVDLARAVRALLPPATPSVLAESTSNDCLLVAEGWQDIASAPNDPPYLTFTPRFGVGLCVRNLNEGVPQSATHWRPLPAPPAVTDLSGVGVG